MKSPKAKPGDKINKFTIIRFHELDKLNRIVWWCRCDCGNESAINNSNIKRRKYCSKKCFYSTKQYIEIGKEYSNIKVLDRIYKNNNTYRYKCECKCGNICELTNTQILKSKLLSCGCAIKNNKSTKSFIADGTEYNHHKFKKGSTYNIWLVDNLYYKSQRQRISIICPNNHNHHHLTAFFNPVKTQCSICNTIQRQEIRANTYIDKTFNNLIIKKYLGLKNTRLQFEYICLCGNKGVLSESQIGKLKSCGCMNRSEHYKEISKNFFTVLKRGAKIRNIPVEITIENIWDLYEKQNRKCALSGQDIVFALGKRNYKITTASVDRIDSSKGYTYDNIQIVHKIVNIMKNKFNQSEFINWCNHISNFSKEGKK